ncbi:MAG: GNAT family N-acetyltransferase [Veillonella sp.]|nr:GNAT family N-acetyltransferase [Veillonella sp.]
MISIVEDDMAIRYTEEKDFTPQQVAELFLSVRWVVGKYPDRLHKALMNSSRVISAWDGDRLIGLIRLMEDAYKSYLYINVMIGESKNATFYEKHGFKVKENSLPMQYRNVPKYTKK